MSEPCGWHYARGKWVMLGSVLTLDADGWHHLRLLGETEEPRRQPNGTHRTLCGRDVNPEGFLHPDEGAIPDCPACAVVWDAAKEEKR